eukprot:2720582-Pyramimonas_sp.AAC.1
MWKRWGRARRGRRMRKRRTWGERKGGEEADEQAPIDDDVAVVLVLGRGVQMARALVIGGRGRASGPSGPRAHSSRLGWTRLENL